MTGEMSELALFGGVPIVSSPLRKYRSLGADERQAVIDVVESGCLSGFYGSPGEEFWGGPQVRKFEAEWARRFGCRHALSVNSNTSGLFAAIGAIGVSPGDEIIVPSTSMSATAVTPLFWGAIPVFADIEDRTFCIDPARVAERISARTKAIIAVNLFGHPARLSELRAMADAHGIFLIEDNAQAPRGMEDGRWTGTVGHIGVFSLNYHKHVHTGEGGVCVTDDDRLANRLALIRNHGENCFSWLEESSPANLLGLNLRMTELSAAVGLIQLRDIENHVSKREQVAQALSRGVDGLAGLQVPLVRPGCRHNYYCWTLRYDATRTGVSRELFGRALTMEGFPLSLGYVPPLYGLPTFRRRLAIGSNGWPFSLSEVSYETACCPVAERLHKDEFILFEPCAWDADSKLVEQWISAFHKVYANLDRLRDHQRRQGP